MEALHRDVRYDVKATEDSRTSAFTQQLTTGQDDDNNPKWVVFRYTCVAALLPGWEDDLN